MKVKTIGLNANKDTKFRKQIADCLKYLCYGELGYWVDRDVIEVYIDEIQGEVNLSTLIQGIDQKDYKDVFVRGFNSEDYVGYKTNAVGIYTYRKQSDNEYFESLCGYILPTEYHAGQYETYLRLKKIYGEEQCTMNIK